MSDCDINIVNVNAALHNSCDSSRGHSVHKGKTNSIRHYGTCAAVQQVRLCPYCTRCETILTLTHRRNPMTRRWSVRLRSSSADEWLREMTSNDLTAPFPCSWEIITEFPNLLIDIQSSNVSIVFLFHLLFMLTKF